MLRTTCRLSLRLRDSRNSNRTLREPTIINSGQRSLYLLNAVGFDHIVHLDVVVAGHLHAALVTLLHLADVVLDALQGVQANGTLRRRVDDHAGADDAHQRRALDGALGDVAAGNGADPADLEDRAD